jgi:D-3-phosphoglycerate dehydrogenase
MRILITDRTHPILQTLLLQAGHEVVVDTSLNRESLLECLPQYNALVVRSKIIIDRPFLDTLRCRFALGSLNLRCIARLGAGMETIDTDYAESLGIRCLNSPEGNRDAVGEHALGLLLALFNNIARADAEVRQGLWQREANRGLELKGRTVGIIGFGNMGGAFAQRLQGFECDIIAYDKYKSAGYAPAYVQEVSLEELQERAQVLSLHVPLTEETRHMVNYPFIRRFRHPFHLINTSRGAVVDTPDLVRALEEQYLLGAALDVIEYEDMTRDGLDMEHLPDAFRYLLNSPRTVLTPHVAGWTIESKEKLAKVLAEKIIETL